MAFAEFLLLLPWGNILSKLGLQPLQPGDLIALLSGAVTAGALAAIYLQSRESNLTARTLMLEIAPRGDQLHADYNTAEMRATRSLAWEFVHFANQQHISTRPALRSSALLAGSSVQRACKDCDRNDELKRKAASADRPGTVPGPVRDHVKSVVASTGVPLDAATRAFMEPRFGFDFGSVKIHADSRAAASARSVNALAYTSGDHLVFASRQYAPTSLAGRKLLAHELAHVVQQAQGPRGSSGILPAHHPSEAEADRAADRVLYASTGPSYAPPALSNAAGLQRLPGPEALLTPAQIAEVQQLFARYQLLVESAAVSTAEAESVALAVAEANAAIASAESVAVAGTSLVAAGDAALVGVGALAADDITGVGVADDVAIPFVLLGAAVAFGLGYLVGSSTAEISQAWDRAARAVARAVELIRRALRAAPRPQPAPTQTETQTDTRQAPRLNRARVRSHLLPTSTSNRTRKTNGRAVAAVPSPSAAEMTVTTALQLRSVG